MDKAQGKKLGMKLLNGLQQQSSTRRAKPLANGSSNQELYELMVANYEERMKVRDDLWPLVSPASPCIVCSGVTTWEHQSTRDYRCHG